MKKELYGSTSLNYKEFKVLPVRCLYRQFSIIFQVGRITTKQDKRESRAYDMHVSYTKKSIGNKFVDYVGPTNYNAMPLDLKKLIYNIISINNYDFRKKNTVHWLLSEL